MITMASSLQRHITNVCFEARILIAMPDKKTFSSNVMTQPVIDEIASAYPLYACAGENTNEILDECQTIFFICRKMVFLSTSIIYPPFPGCQLPLKEDALDHTSE